MANALHDIRRLGPLVGQSLARCVLQPNMALSSPAGHVSPMAWLTALHVQLLTDESQWRRHACAALVESKPLAS